MFNCKETLSYPQSSPMLTISRQPKVSSNDDNRIVRTMTIWKIVDEEEHETGGVSIPSAFTKVSNNSDSSDQTGYDSNAYRKYIDETRVSRQCKLYRFMWTSLMHQNALKRLTKIGSIYSPVTEFTDTE